MRIIRRREWDIPESAATDETVFWNRRTLLATSVATAAGAMLGPARARAGAVTPTNPDRAVTAEKYVENYNNYYEFSDDKDCASLCQKLRIAPWTIRFDGLVKQPKTLGYDDLLKLAATEVRTYRHRCVEAWSMVVPWTGFPMKKLLDIAEPLGSAKFLKFTTIEQPGSMPGLDNPIYPWPYVEAVTIAEAANELAFISTGAYGKDLPKQDGAPIRMTLPWKYGFKSGKAFVNVSFVDRQPDTFWATLGPDEYGFWANVNPAVPHPRWSQATERVLGTDERIPTVIYNGYGAYVSPLYASMKGVHLFR